MLPSTPAGSANGTIVGRWAVYIAVAPTVVDTRIGWIFDDISGNSSMPSDDCRRAPLTDSVSSAASPFAIAALRSDDTSAIERVVDSYGGPTVVRASCRKRSGNVGQI